MTRLVFFSGREAGASCSYEGLLFKCLEDAGVELASVVCHYAANRANRAWFDYTPTWAEVATIPRAALDTYTYNVSEATIDALVAEHADAEGADIYVGASQGGVLACEFAIRAAKNGKRVKLILLSSSPTARQLLDLQELGNQISAYATVGWWEKYFGSCKAFLQKSVDAFATPNVLWSRLETFAKVAMFNSSHCRESHWDFIALAEWVARAPTE